MRNNPLRILLLSLVIVCAVASRSDAWLRSPYDDETIVSRSDVIVVAAIKDGSLQYIPHPPERNGGGSSWEYHAILKVSQVMKGNAKAKPSPTEIPIVMEYGIGPVTSGGSSLGPHIQLIPTKAPLGIESFSDVPVPILSDALKENIWLLRLDKSGAYYVTDPEDMQPIEMKDYLACYLAKDPESAVRAQLQRQPEIARRAVQYLDHREIQRIEQEQDPARRAERLMPYFLNRQSWQNHSEAMQALAKCGQAAGPYLLAAYDPATDAPLDESLQEDIIRLFGETHYAGATEPLIKLLENNNRFWASQKLQQGWWNMDVDSPRTELRRSRYGLVLYAVNALGEIGSPTARPAIEQTRQCWTAIAFENPQIVEACDQALAKLAQPAK